MTRTSKDVNTLNHKRVGDGALSAATMVCTLCECLPPAATVGERKSTTPVLAGCL